MGVERERLVGQPDRTVLDGAVVELAVDPDTGLVSVDNVRIPGPPVP
jgi:hypothetical protein